MLEYKIVNIVAQVNFGYDVDLIKLKSINDKVLYDPEEFAAARLKYNKINFNIFRTGKIGIQGAISEEELKQAIAYLEAIVPNCRKQEG